MNEARDAERARRGRQQKEMGFAPGLKEWRESLGVSLRQLSMEVGTVERPSRYGGSLRKIDHKDIHRLEVGERPQDERTRLLIAQALWYLEQRKRDEIEEARERAARLQAAGVR